MYFAVREAGRDGQLLELGCKLALELRVDQLLVIAQPRLDLPTDVIHHRLRGLGLDGIQSGRGDHGGRRFLALLLFPWVDVSAV